MTGDGIVDPRGASAAEVLTPARRLPSLDGGRVLLVDNGKLDPVYGPFAALWDVVRARWPNAVWSTFSDDLLRHDDRAIEEIGARLIAEFQPEAAILALADVGVSLGTTLLALAFERQGIPTAILATPVGARCISGVFDSLAPELEPVALDALRTDSRERVVQLAQGALAAIEARLTSTIGRPAQAAPRFDPPRLPGAESWAGTAHAMHAFQDWAEGQELGDGLPLVPPTAAAIDALLATVREDPESVIFGPALVSGRVLRVRDAAANAAMTSCPPRAFPVVVAALRAMAKPGYRLNQAAVTTHPAGSAIVFSGAGAAGYALSGGPGCLGPGHRGNAAAGRAVSLAILSVFGARPGGSDLTTFGSPAEFTYCFAEAVEASWPPLAAERGDGSPGVLVVKCEGPRNVIDAVSTHPQTICEAFAATATNLGANNAYLPGDLLVMINPEHARIFAGAGWSRADVARAIHELARVPRALVEGRGLIPIRPAYMDALDWLPATRTADDVHVVVAGAAGIQSMVALPWGYSRAQWSPIAGA